jgi:hypothetical protein
MCAVGRLLCAEARWVWYGLTLTATDGVFVCFAQISEISKPYRTCMLPDHVSAAHGTPIECIEGRRTVGGQCVTHGRALCAISRVRVCAVRSA